MKANTTMKMKMKKSKSPWADMKPEAPEEKAEEKTEKNLAELERKFSKSKPPQTKPQATPGKRKLGAAGTSQSYKSDQVRHTLNKLLGKE